MNKERIIFSVFLLLLPVFFTGCNRQEEPISKTGFYFDTVITVTLYDASATEELEECFSLAEKYENMLSATREGSDIWNLNHAAGNATEVSEETAAVGSQLLDRNLAGRRSQRDHLLGNHRFRPVLMFHRNRL